ncbi:hypothetical protein TNCV_811021 [Trichonephila clavipes]|uniref:Uncharacterized protein n=1 Tax=Trichonephila clavipes TaxID=2585209 RepID=A0A8X6S884_TRICX|nr:hypothetical protein TNCV_811021 [Trichonephila clavipes]
MILPALIDKPTLTGRVSPCRVHGFDGWIKIQQGHHKKYDSGGKNCKSFDNGQTQEHSNNTDELQGEAKNNEESSCRKCGKSKINKGGKIIHGDVTPLNKYPWIYPFSVKAVSLSGLPGDRCLPGS